VPFDQYRIVTVLALSLQVGHFGVQRDTSGLNKFSIHGLK